MGILDKLTNGSENDSELFSVYIQFDDDDVIMLSPNIDTENEFVLSLHPDDKNYVEIKDNATDKKVKIFAKRNE